VCGEAMQQFSVLESRCVRTQINQTQNLEKLTGELLASNHSQNGGRLSKFLSFFSFLCVNIDEQIWSVCTLILARVSKVKIFGWISITQHQKICF
jgi:hypothetical protein